MHLKLQSGGLYGKTANILASGPAQFLIVVGFVIGLILIVIDLHDAKVISDPWFDKITLSLAVAAIVFAVWQFRDARVQESRMEDVARGMSTRFVGFFPNNMGDINEVALHASQSLDILSDYVGYGHYSSPDEFEVYRRQLEDLVEKKVKIRMVVYTYPSARRTYDTQFLDKDFCEAITSRSGKWGRFCQRFATTKFCADFNQQKRLGFDAAFCKKLDLKQNTGEKQALEKSKEGTGFNTQKRDFDQLMFSRQVAYMTELVQRGVDLRQTDSQLPFFLWNEDNQEVVISFLNEGSKAEREVSFRTRDISLISKTFQPRFKEIFDKATPVNIKYINNQPVADWNLNIMNK